MAARLLTKTMSADNLITSFATRYQLEQNRHPFKREAVRELPIDCCGVYALWIPGEIEGRVHMPLCWFVYHMCAAAVA